MLIFVDETTAYRGIQASRHTHSSSVPVLSSLQRRNVTVSGRRTSMRLEASMWAAAQEIARREQTTIDEICTMVSTQQSESSLTSSMRVYILNYFWDLAGRLEPENADQT